MKDSLDALKYEPFNMFEDGRRAFMAALLVFVVGCDTSSPSAANVDPKQRKYETDGPLRLSNLRENEVASIGQQGFGYVDEASGQVAWRALTCVNPACSRNRKDDRELVFSIAYPQAEVLIDGRVAMPSTEEIQQYSKQHYRCPKCGEGDWIREYDPPEVVERRELLEAELTASRVARREAKRAGLAMPTGNRTPIAIMSDITALPRLYVVPEN